MVCGRCSVLCGVCSGRFCLCPALICPTSISPRCGGRNLLLYSRQLISHVTNWIHMHHTQHLHTLLEWPAAERNPRACGQWTTVSELRATLHCAEVAHNAACSATCNLHMCLAGGWFVVHGFVWRGWVMVFWVMLCCAMLRQSDSYLCLCASACVQNMCRLLAACPEPAHVHSIIKAAFVLHTYTTKN